MTWFEATLDEVFVSPDPVDVVRDRFGDRSAIIAATRKAVSTELVGEDGIHFVLAEQQHGPQRFQPDYTVHYRRDGEDQVWSTASGNMTLEGRASFTARADGGTDVHYRSKIAFELPIPRLLAAPLRGVVSRLAQPELRDYARQMAGSRDQAGSRGQ